MSDPLQVERFKTGGLNVLRAELKKLKHKKKAKAKQC